MPTLSVLTATYYTEELTSFLPETIQSVCGQQLPSGWQLEWVVQEDGVRPRVEPLLHSVPEMRYETNGQQLGTSCTRNLALSRVTGELVRVLDHDDVLLPGSLAALIEVFQDPSVQWAAGQADDLLPSGERIAFPSALPDGLLEPGVVNDWILEHGTWPIHCAGLMIRTPVLRAVGGWVGLPTGDDIAMLSLLSEISVGYNHPDTLWLYRRYPEQTSRSSEWLRRSSTGQRIALQRVAAVREVGLALRSQPVPTR